MNWVRVMISLAIGMFFGLCFFWVLESLPANFRAPWVVLGFLVVITIVAKVTIESAGKTFTSGGGSHVALLALFLATGLAHADPVVSVESSEVTTPLTAMARQGSFGPNEPTGAEDLAAIFSVAAIFLALRHEPRGRGGTRIG